LEVAVASLSADDGELIVQHVYAAGDASQIWLVTSAGSSTSGYYALAALSSGKVLDVEDASTADGANVHQWSWWGGDNQQWEFLLPGTTVALTLADVGATRKTARQAAAAFDVGAIAAGLPSALSKVTQQPASQFVVRPLDASKANVVRVQVVDKAGLTSSRAVAQQIVSASAEAWQAAGVPVVSATIVPLEGSSSASAGLSAAAIVGIVVGGVLLAAAAVLLAMVALKMLVHSSSAAPSVLPIAQSPSTANPLWSPATEAATVADKTDAEAASVPAQVLVDGATTVTATVPPPAVGRGIRNTFYRWNPLAA